MSDKKLNKSHPRKVKELEHVRQAIVMAKLSSVGLATLGAFKPSIGKVLNTTLIDQASLGTLGWGMVIGGVGAYLMTSLASSPWLKKENAIYREGVDNQVNAPEYMKFCGSLAKSAAYQSSNTLVDKLLSLGRGSEHPRDFFDHSTLKRNSVNIIHALALLGSDNSRYAKRLKEEPGFRDKAVTAVFDNSDRLLKLMKPNEKNLYQFSETVRKSLGADAEYILKDYRDYNKGMTEWRGLVSAVSNETLSKVQEANMHHHFSYLISNAFRESLHNEFTPVKAKKLVRELALFRPLKRSYNSGTPIHKTAALASKLAGMIRTLERNDKLDLFHELQILPIDKEKAYLDPPVSKDPNDPAVTRAKNALLSSWLITPEIRPVEEVFTEALLKKLTDSAIKGITDLKSTQSSFYQGMDPEKAIETLEAMGVKPGQGLKGVTPESAADTVVNRVKQRVAQAVVQGDALHSTDQKDNPEQTRAQRWGIRR